MRLKRWAAFIFGIAACLATLVSHAGDRCEGVFFNAESARSNVIALRDFAPRRSARTVDPQLTAEQRASVTIEVETAIRELDEYQSILLIASTIGALDRRVTPETELSLRRRHTRFEAAAERYIELENRTTAIAPELLQRFERAILRVDHALNAGQLLPALFQTRTSAIANAIATFPEFARESYNTGRERFGTEILLVRLELILNWVERARPFLRRENGFDPRPILRTFQLIDRNILGDREIHARVDALARWSLSKAVRRDARTAQAHWQRLHVLLSAMRDGGLAQVPRTSQ